MKKCKSCKSEIDAKATKCPHCQADQRGWARRHPILTGLLVLFIVGSVMAAAGGGENKPKTTNNNSAANTDSAQETQSAQEEPTVEAIETTKVVTTDFIAEFDKNQLAAEEKYKDKLVEFTAVIANISEDILGTPFLSLKPSDDKYYAGTTIKCDFKEKSQLTSFANGQTITLQGSVSTQSLGIISIKDCKAIQ
jgi:hypothetical protein